MWNTSAWNSLRIPHSQSTSKTSKAMNQWLDKFVQLNRGTSIVKNEIMKKVLERIFKENLKENIQRQELLQRHDHSVEKECEK